MLGGQSSNVTCSSGQVFGSARTLKADGISGFIWAFSSIESNQLSKKEEKIPPWCSSCEDCSSLFTSAFFQACCISCYHGDLAFCADWVDMFPLQNRQNTFCQLAFSVCEDFSPPPACHHLTLLQNITGWQFDCSHVEGALVQLMFWK